MGRRVDIFGSWCVRELMNLQVCEFLNLKLMSKCIQQLLFFYEVIDLWVDLFFILYRRWAFVSYWHHKHNKLTIYKHKKLRQRLNLLQKDGYSPKSPLAFRFYLHWLLLLFTRGYTGLCYQQTKWKCQTRAKSIT